MSLNSFRAIVELWPSRESLRAELGAGEWVVTKWWQRNSIPPEWWSALVSLPIAIKEGVTLELLATLAAAEREVA